MVKIGFIGEGDTEKRVLSSENFRNLLHQAGLDFVPEVIDAEGGGNLFPNRIQSFVKVLQDKGATHIIILTDKEEAPCISEVKKRIQPVDNQIVIVAVKTIESWFLADSSTISRLMRISFYCEHPESVPSPFHHIKEEMLRLTSRGVAKTLLCSRMLLNGFSIENAATHSRCPSARYFLEKLKQLAQENP
jgi:hypothetical protein